MKIRYVHGFFHWKKLCRNWYVVVLMRLGLMKRDVVLKFRNGLKLKVYNRGKDSDTAIVGNIFFHHPYTQNGYELHDGDVVVDIGANIAIFALYAHVYSKKGKIFCYEPAPDNFSYLTYNIEANNLQQCIRAHCSAVAGERGTKKLFLHSRGSGGHSFFPYLVETRMHQSIDVHAVTLTDIFKENNLDHIDFLKLDCEGAEYEILFNTPPEYFKKISRIALEHHSVQGQSPRQLEKFLHSQGYEVKRTDEIIQARRV